MLKRQRQCGFSVPELMVAIAVGLVLLTLLMNTFVSNSKNAQVNMDRARLNIMMFQALNRMTTEVVRSGGWNVGSIQGWNTDYQIQINSAGNIISPGNPGSFPMVSSSDVGPIIIVGTGSGFSSGAARILSYNGTGASASGEILESFDGGPPPTVQIAGSSWAWGNPFNYADDGTNKLQILDDQATRSCILFTYDKYGDGIMHTSVGTNDRFGYRLQDNNGVGVVQQRTGGTTFTCTPGVNNTWIDITDVNEMNVTALQFTDTQTNFTANGKTVVQHDINISISANLIDDANAAYTTEASVLVRNNTLNLS